ncbi:MAG: hypothetical protein D6785_14020, partial [Planctomycetota bacterium]
MERDFAAEKRVKWVSWLVWKFQGILLVFMGFLYLGILGIAYFQGKLPQELLRKTDSKVALAALILLVAIGCFFWYAGKSLERLKPWSRWLTGILSSLHLLYSLIMGSVYGYAFFITLNKIPKTEAAIALIMLIIIILMGFLFYLWVFRALFDSRARIIFSRAYRERLAHNSFPHYAVGREKPLPWFDRYFGPLSILFYFILIIAIIAAIAVPNLLSARKAANEAGAIGTLRALYSSEQQFKLLKLNQGNYGDFMELQKKNLFSFPKNAGKNRFERHGYIFELHLVRQKGSSPST